MTRPCLLCAAMVLAIPVFAQIPLFAQIPDGGIDVSDLARRQAFGIGAGINFGLYSGDIDEAKEGFTHTSVYWRPGADAHATYRLGILGEIGTLHLRATYGYHPLRAGSDEYVFVNYTTASTTGLQLEVFPRSPMRLYAHAGAGYMQFRLTAHENEPGFMKRHSATPGAAQGALVFPIGVGLLWYAGRNADISWEFTKMLTSTDNLDGWMANIRDNFQYISIGLQFYF